MLQNQPGEETGPGVGEGAWRLGGSSDTARKLMAMSEAEDFLGLEMYWSLGVDYEFDRVFSSVSRKI